MPSASPIQAANCLKSVDDGRRSTPIRNLHQTFQCEERISVASAPPGDDHTNTTRRQMIQLAGPAMAAAAFAAKAEPALDVRSFGVAGDGSADDTAAINL